MIGGRRFILYKQCNIKKRNYRHKGVGLSGQMHGLVMLDKDDNVLRKSIIWCDQRTQKECDEITEIIGAKRLIDITANPALTGSPHLKSDGCKITSENI